MTVPVDKASRLAVIGVTVLVLGGLGVVAARTPTPVLINESPSLPRGLYLRDAGAPIERGTTVALSQPAAGRAYLQRLGMPSGVLLIKRVAAADGDCVCRRGDAIRAAGRTVSVRTRDRLGAPLPQWRGCRRLGLDELFVLGDTPGSFDSRYFGPVSRADVDGVFRETLTW